MSQQQGRRMSAVERRGHAALEIFCIAGLCVFAGIGVASSWPLPKLRRQAAQPIPTKKESS